MRWSGHCVRPGDSELDFFSGAEEHGHDENTDENYEHAAEGGDGHGDHDVCAAAGGGEYGQEGEDGGSGGHEAGAQAALGGDEGGFPDGLDGVRLLFAEDLVEVGGLDDAVV